MNDALLLLVAVALSVAMLWVFTKAVYGSFTYYASWAMLFVGGLFIGHYLVRVFT